MSKHTGGFLSHQIIAIKQQNVRHELKLSWDTFCSPFFICLHLHRRSKDINCATHSDTNILIWKWKIPEHFILNLVIVYWNCNNNNRRGSWKQGEIFLFIALYSIGTETSLPWNNECRFAFFCLKILNSIWKIQK